MKVTHVLVCRKYNLGNYQTIDLQLEADIEVNEDPVETMKRLEKYIDDYYKGRGPDLASLP